MITLREWEHTSHKLVVPVGESIVWVQLTEGRPSGVVDGQTKYMVVGKSVDDDDRNLIEKMMFPEDRNASYEGLPGGYTPVSLVKSFETYSKAEQFPVQLRLGSRQPPHVILNRPVYYTDTLEEAKEQFEQDLQSITDNILMELEADEQIAAEEKPESLTQDEWEDQQARIQETP